MTTPETPSVLEIYTADLEPDLAAAVTALNGAIRAAGPQLRARIGYGLLMYVLGSDLRHWVAAIDTGRSKPGARRQAVHVRLLYGAWMNDPRQVLRPGSSHLSTIDFTAPDRVDLALVSEYVKEAYNRHAEFVAREK